MRKLRGDPFHGALGHRALGRVTLCSSFIWTTRHERNESGKLTAFFRQHRRSTPDAPPEPWSPFALPFPEQTTCTTHARKGLPICPCTCPWRAPLSQASSSMHAPMWCALHEPQGCMLQEGFLRKHVAADVDAGCSSWKHRWSGVSGSGIAIWRFHSYEGSGGATADGVEEASSLKRDYPWDVITGTRVGKADTARYARARLCMPSEGVQHAHCAQRMHRMHCHAWLHMDKRDRHARRKAA